MITTGAPPHPWLPNGTDLEKNEKGFMLLKPSLQSATTDPIFGTGDCVCFGNKFGENFSPDTGVYAVRQAAVLIKNILTLLKRLWGRPCRHGERPRCRLHSSQIVPFTDYEGWSVRNWGEVRYSFQRALIVVAHELH